MKSLSHNKEITRRGSIICSRPCAQGGFFLLWLPRSQPITTSISQPQNTEGVQLTMVPSFLIRDTFSRRTE